MYTDESLSCVDCNSQFIFSSGEQQFFASKGFQNKPNRCPECRAARKAQCGRRRWRKLRRRRWRRSRSRRRSRNVPDHVQPVRTNGGSAVPAAWRQARLLPRLLPDPQQLVPVRHCHRAPRSDSLAKKRPARHDDERAFCYAGRRPRVTSPYGYPPDTSGTYP
jgi:hypothetical protein